jgi:hypothetical protein
MDERGNEEAAGDEPAAYLGAVPRSLSPAQWAHWRGKNPQPYLPRLRTRRP